MTADLSTLAWFRPYVYGATLGVPSRGRPQRVLDAGLVPETIVRRLERELDLNPQPLRGLPASASCGTRAAYRRHKRRGEPACEACRAAERTYALAYAARRKEARP